MSNTIPNIAHLIWYGSDMPDNYKKHLNTWAKQNPGITVKLWSSRSSMSAKDFNTLQNFCKHHNVRMIDIDKTSVLNKQLIAFEIQNRNWARASDISRYGILYNEGGYYFDTDLIPIAPLDLDFKAPQEGTLQYISPTDKNRQLNIYFMAAVPQHPLFKATLDYIEQVYTLVRETDFSKWINTKDKRILAMVTSDLTGGALQRVFNGAGYSRENVAFTLTKHVNIRCDQSWLRDVVPEEGNEALFEYIKFMELRNSRLYDTQLEKSIFDQAKLPSAAIPMDIERRGKREGYSGPMGFFHAIDKTSSNMVEENPNSELPHN